MPLGGCHLDNFMSNSNPKLVDTSCLRLCLIQKHITKVHSAPDTPPCAPLVPMKSRFSACYPQTLYKQCKLGLCRIFPLARHSSVVL